MNDDNDFSWTIKNGSLAYNESFICQKGLLSITNEEWFRNQALLECVSYGKSLNKMMAFFELLLTLCAWSNYPILRHIQNIFQQQQQKNSTEQREAVNGPIPMTIDCESCAVFDS